MKAKPIVVFSAAAILILGSVYFVNSKTPSSKSIIDKPVEEIKEKVASSTAKKEAISVKAEEVFSKNIHFFLENSGSMNGYLSGNNDFKEDINLIIRNLQLNKVINTYYINTKSYPSGKNIDGFLKDLTVSGVKGFGTQLSSDINAMFKEAIARTADGSVSILVSDGIYSIEGVNDKAELISMLKSEKLKTRNTLLGIIKERNLSASIIQLTSQFNGTYYCANGDKLKINGKQRPYYMWVFGNPQAIDNALKEIDIKGLSGYENAWRYFRADKIKVPYSILTTGSEKIGLFQSAKHGAGLVTEIKDCKRSRNKKEFGFGVAIDLSNYNLNDAYILNKANFQVKGVKESYEILSIVPIKDFSKRTQIALKALPKTFKPTHIITILTKSSFLGEISLELQNKQPNWINESNTNDDSSVSSVKTFGFGYLMDGFNMTYSRLNKKENYFELPIIINR